MPSTKDSQSRRYQITLNNPEEHGYTPEVIKKRLLENFSSLIYFCFAKEIGLENKTPHYHIFCCFSSRVRFSKIQRHFHESHIEKVKASIIDNINYVKKCGKWHDDPKADTCIKGSFFEFGNPPAEKGKRTDLRELYDMIEAGMSNSDILKENTDMILVLEKIDKVRTALLTDKYMEYRRINLRVTYIQGRAGCGKTSGVLNACGDGNVYIISDLRHPWDSYDPNRHSVIFFDEFRDSFPLKKMLVWLDIYAGTFLEARYSPKLATYENVYIASNWELERQYQEEKEKDFESYKAWLRRIHNVKVYNADDTITLYNSVNDYLNRDTAIFESVSQQMEIPFENAKIEQ